MRSLYWKSVWGLAALLACAAIASAEHKTDLTGPVRKKRDRYGFT